MFMLLWSLKMPGSESTVLFIVVVVGLVLCKKGNVCLKVKPLGRTDVRPGFFQYNGQGSGKQAAIT